MNSRLEQQSLGKIFDTSGNYIFAIERMPEAKKCEAQIVACRQYCVRLELVCSRHRHTPRYTRPYIPTQMTHSDRIWLMGPGQGRTQDGGRRHW